MGNFLRRSWRGLLAAMILAAVAAPIAGYALAADREGGDRDRPEEVAREQGPRDPERPREGVGERGAPRDDARADRPGRETRRDDETRRGPEANDRRPDRPGDSPHPKMPELERRQHHLRVAAENLRAAGFPEQAEHIMHEARRLGEPRDPEHDSRETDGPRRAGPPPREHVEHLERAIHELREQVEMLRNQMDQMRRHVERLTAEAARK
ncbi:MAG: hypothetical protein GXY83_44755 [Rhodopirellula sp.]|nr:hypothetical protein [Rhodopirellula sp.]